jgi:hypothetical protein
MHDHTRNSRQNQACEADAGTGYAADDEQAPPRVRVGGGRAHTVGQLIFGPDVINADDRLPRTWHRRVQKPKSATIVQWMHRESARAEVPTYSSFTNSTESNGPGKFEDRDCGQQWPYNYVQDTGTNILKKGDCSRGPITSGSQCEGHTRRWCVRQCCTGRHIPSCSCTSHLSRT